VQSQRRREAEREDGAVEEREGGEEGEEGEDSGVDVE